MWCEFCGYDLRGIDAVDTCPECGGGLRHSRRVPYRPLTHRDKGMIGMYIGATLLSAVNLLAMGALRRPGSIDVLSVVVVVPLLAALVLGWWVWNRTRRLNERVSDVLAVLIAGHTVTVVCVLAAIGIR